MASVHGRKSIKSVASLILALSVVSVSCARPRDARPRELTLKTEIAASKNELGPQTWEQIQSLFELYAVDGQLTSRQLIQLFHQFAPELKDFITGTIGGAPDKTFSFAQFSQTLESHCLTLAWLKKGSLADSPSRLSTLQLVYPQSNPKTQAELNRMMTAAWANADRMAPADILKAGVIFSQTERAAHASPAAQVLMQKLAGKILWSTQPEIQPELFGAQDRQLATLTATAHLLIAKENLAAPADDPALAKTRSFHRAYYRVIARFQKPDLNSNQSKNTELQEAAESYDWQLNLAISEVLRAATPEVSEREAKMVFPSLFYHWRQSPGYLDHTSTSLVQDLFSASASDDLMGLCHLSSPQALDKSFVSKFLSQVAQLDMSLESGCAPVEKIFLLSIPALPNPAATASGL